MAPKKKSTSAAKREAEDKKSEEKTADAKDDSKAEPTEAEDDSKAEPPEATVEEEEGDYVDEGDDAEEDQAEEKNGKAEDGDDDKEEEDDDGDKKSEAKGKEKLKELEVDAEFDSRERVASTVALSEYDSTLNAFFSGGGTIVSSLSQGGLQYLLSGVRANTGATAGRYYFETKVLEKKFLEKKISFAHHLRVGVSIAKSSLFLGDGTDNACFDVMEGYYYAAAPESNKTKSKVMPRAIQFQVIGILLNLESGSPNANTLSLFVDGVRQCEPQPLPAHLIGKALYPTLTFKNYTLAVNLGSEGLVLKSLPFKCRMFGDISAADAETSSFESPAGSKYSVILPVGLPEEGFFDYVDRFIENHPEYVELSDRKIFEWCEKSGLKHWKKPGTDTCRDRPVFNFGYFGIDNKSLRLLMRNITQLVKRNYLVTELNGNLLSKEREEVLARFGAPHFSVSAHIAIGEPNAEHKEWVHSSILGAHAKKQALAKKKAEEKEKEKERAAQRKEKRLAEKEKAKAGKKGDAEKEEGDVKKEEDKDEVIKEEVDAEEPAAKKQKVGEDEKETQPEAAPPDVGPNVWWIPRQKGDPEDVFPKTVAQNYLNFTLPSEPEGFEKVEFVWSSKAETEEYMKKWTSDKKATLVVEGLKPGEWFKEKEKAWTQLLKEMKTKKQDKKPNKESEKDKKAPSKESDKADKDKESKEAAPEEKKEEEDQKPPEPAAPDPLHAGGEDGKPLYANFQREDWVLLGFRYELHLVLHAFNIDVKDPEYVGVPVEHLGHYYNVYFQKKFGPQSLGCKKLEEVVELMDDVLKIETKGVLRYVSPLLDKETEVVHFVSKAEEEREDRNRRMEAGDESARLRIPEFRERREGDRKGKGKGKKGGKRDKQNDARRGGASTQDGRGTIQGKWVKRSTFMRKRMQDGDGQRHGAGGRREAQPLTRPWDRTNNRQARPFHRFANRASFGGKGNAKSRPPLNRGHQDSRNLQTRRPQQDERRQPPGRESAKGDKREAPRRHAEQDFKRPRNESHNQASHSRGPQTDRRTPSNNPQSGRREPQRSAAPAALPASSHHNTHRDASRGKSQSKGHSSREGGGDRDRKGGFRDSGNRDYRDGGSHRPSHSQGGHSKGGSKGGHSSGSHHSADKRSHDNGSHRTHSSKGGKGSGRGDDRRDGRDRGHTSSSRQDSRSDYHSNDRNRRW